MKNKKMRSPVCREGCECEHRHPHRSQLDEGDDFTAHSPEKPLVRQVATRIHGSAGQQQQDVTQRQARHEEVGHIPEAFSGRKCLDEGDVAHQSQHADHTVDRSDDNPGD